jgi:hypothetical protein
VLVPPAKDQRAAMAPILLNVIAQWRNRIETTFSEITNLMELVLVAYLSAHRTMINGSALCAALAVTERD